MYDRNWDEPVSADLPDIGRVVISNTRQAADCLMEHWPRDHGSAFDEALRIFLEVYEGRETPEAARKAFMRAAQVAAVQLTPADPRDSD
ncbi:MAG: DUF982 domain-containing protein [Rhizobiaceae bacterium]|nr:DUF982 domain-containing protein [Rhizobiaceae bacterium]